MELFEEKFSIRLNALSAILHEYERPNLDDLYVYGELHPQTGNELKCSIELIVAVYDTNGNIIGMESKYFIQTQFFGFEVFSVCINNLPECPEKIKILPKKM